MRQGSHAPSLAFYLSYDDILVWITYFHFWFPKLSPFSTLEVLGCHKESSQPSLPRKWWPSESSKCPFVATGWEMSLWRSPSLLWPQSMRIEMLMWHYEWEVRTVQPFVDRKCFGLIEMCAYSRENAIGRCSHSQHSEIAKALGSLLSRFSFERQLDIFIMACKCIPLYNASDYSDSQDKPHIS